MNRKEIRLFDSISSFDAEKELHTKIWEAVADHVLLLIDNVKQTALKLTTIEVDGNIYTGKGEYEVTLFDNDDNYEGEVTGVYKKEKHSQK